MPELNVVQSLYIGLVYHATQLVGGYGQAVSRCSSKLQKKRIHDRMRSACISLWLFLAPPSLPLCPGLAMALILVDSALIASRGNIATSIVATHYRHAACWIFLYLEWIF